MSLINKTVPWANVKVRQAMAYAIDKAAIVKGLLHGVPTDYPRLMPDELGYDPNLKDYKIRSRQGAVIAERSRLCQRLQHAALCLDRGVFRHPGNRRSGGALSQAEPQHQHQDAGHSAYPTPAIDRPHGEGPEGRICLGRGPAGGEPADAARR